MRDETTRPIRDAEPKSDPAGAGRRADGSPARAVSRSLLEEVRGAWRTACERREPRLPALHAAVVDLARDARANGGEAAAVLRALDSVIRPEQGGDRRLDCDHVRELLGRTAIRAFYRDD